MSSTIVKALTATIASLAKLPATPVFDGEKLSKTLLEGGIENDAVLSMVEFAAKKHTEKHGDTETVALKAAISSLAKTLGTDGLDRISRIAGNLASEARNAGKICFTRSQFDAALAGKPEEGEKEINASVVAIVNKAREMRRNSKPWSVIEEECNLSPSSRQALYMAANDHKSFKFAATK